MPVIYRLHKLPEGEQSEISIEDGLTLAEGLMALSESRWGNLHVEVYRHGTQIDILTAPSVYPEPGEHVEVYVLPAFAGLPLFASAILKLAISFAVSALLSNLSSPKPLTGVRPGTESPTPLNTLQPPRNGTRLGSRVADIYGEMRTWPDLIFPVVEEWSGRSQVVKALYCIGEGEMQIRNVRVGGTDLEQLTGAAVTIYPPGSSFDRYFDLVRNNATLESVVLDIPSEGGDWTDWAQLPGTEVDELWADFFMPRGAREEDPTTGKDRGYRHTVNIEYRTVDLVTGARGPTQLRTWSIIFNSLSPRIYTERIEVTPAAYEMRFRRTDNDQTTDKKVLYRGLTINKIASMVRLTQEQREVEGVTLAYLQIDNSSGDSTTTFNARSRLNMLAQRVLPIVQPDGSLGAPLPTLRWVDAMAHMLTAQDLGRYPVNEIDWDALVAAQSRMETRTPEGVEGGEFSAVFDELVSVDDQLRSAANMARATLYHDGARVGVAVDRDISEDDTGAAVPSELQVSGLFNRRNRQSGDVDSGIAYSSSLPDDNDGVEITWFDRRSGYIRRTLTYSPTPAVPLNPVREDGIGMVKWSQVYRHAVYVYNKLRYRRQSTSISAFEDARLVSPMDVLSVVQPWRETVIDGELVDYDDNVIVTLDRDPLPLPPSPMLRIRSEDGQQTDLIDVTAGPGANQLTLDRVPSIPMISGVPTGQIGQLYALTTQANDDADRWLVLQAGGNYQDGTLALSNYDGRVFDGDKGAIPQPPEPPFDPIPGVVPLPTFMMGWRGAPGDDPGSDKIGFVNEDSYRRTVYIEGIVTDQDKRIPIAFPPWPSSYTTLVTQYFYSFDLTDIDWGGQKLYFEIEFFEQGLNPGDDIPHDRAHYASVELWQQQGPINGWQRRLIFRRNRDVNELEYYPVAAPFLMIPVTTPKTTLDSGDRWGFALDLPHNDNVGKAHWSINGQWVNGEGPSGDGAAENIFLQTDPGSDDSKWYVVVILADQTNTSEIMDGNFRCRMYQHSGQVGANTYGGPPSGYIWTGESNNPDPNPPL